MAIECLPLRGKLLLESFAAQLSALDSHTDRDMDDDPKLRWFAAVLVVRVQIEGAWQDDYLIDHQVRLVRASDPETAFSRALELGTAEEQSYRNGDGELVVWKFDGLADLDEIRADQLADGLEVWSWRSRGQPGDSVLAKEKLAVFWLAANGHRRVDELLD